MNGFFSRLKEFLSMSTYKKCGTLSGALVFFILLGIIPVTYIISLVFSVFGAEIALINKIFDYPEYNEITSYLIETAKKMGVSGNVIVFIVALFSSANVFYHLKQSGEVIYNYSAKNTLLIRIITIIITFISVVIISLALVFYVAIIPVIVNACGERITLYINVGVGIVSVFLLFVAVNYFACPFKLEFYEVYKGALYTTAFSVIATLLFFVYIRNFSNFSEIYGKIGVVIVFLSWLYLMVNGMFQGILLNVYFMGRRKNKKYDLKYTPFYSKLNKKV
ncbi:MAG: YihY/virulence factor BrkB family protein [Clostridia bacterium]|nr:YihY/virulence factor BrkB family protein [Clostridia bacterium]